MARAGDRDRELGRRPRTARGCRDTPSASYTTDLLANPVGGARQGFEYAGELEASLEFDLERLLGLEGSSFSIAASWASGRDLSERKIGNLFTVAQAFEGQSVRLAQMYFEQELLEERLSLAVGRLSTGDDFATSELYEDYVNAGVNGNPLSISLNAESFSSDPVASWGLRAIALPARRFRLAAGFYNADPEVGEDNRNGVDFALDPQDGVLAIAEAGYRRNQEEGDTGLPGNLTVGGYYDSSDYESLNDPGDERRGSYGLYVLLDQMVYREDGAGSAEGLTPWAAFTFAPIERVNPLPFFAAGGSCTRACSEAAPTTPPISACTTASSAMTCRTGASRLSSRQITASSWRRGSTSRPTSSTSSGPAAVTMSRTRRCSAPRSESISETTQPVRSPGTRQEG